MKTLLVLTFIFASGCAQKPKKQRELCHLSVDGLTICPAEKKQ